MKLLFTSMCCVVFMRINAQEVTAVPDTVVVEQVVPRSTLTIGATYVNNADYYGQKAAEKTPYIALVAAYRHKSGFYLTGLGYRLLKDSSTLGSAYALGAGYEFKAASNFTIDVSYSYSFYPALSPFLQAANPHNAGITFTRTGWLNASVALNYAFGQTNDAFATAGVSKEIGLFSITKKDVVTFTPVLDVTAGTQHFFEYYVQEKRTRDSLLGLPLPPIFGGGMGGGTTTTTTTKMKTTFDLLSYNLKLPLAYSRANYTFEAATQLSLLSDHATTGAGKFNSFFSASFYYQF